VAEFPSGYRVRQIGSVAELSAEAASWDDLWWRSDTTIPTARAALLAQWVARFQPHSDFHALVVMQDGRWVAALPMVHVKAKRCLSVGALAGDDRAVAGDLLLDVNEDTTAVMESLLSAVCELPWAAFWFERCNLCSRPWRTFVGAVRQAGADHDVVNRYEVGRICTDGEWERCKQQWSSSHRQSVTRSMRKMEGQGVLQFHSLTSLAEEDVKVLVRKGFEIEDRSWKGKGGTSVLKKGQLEFYVRQAVQLAKWGQLALTFLESKGKPIAFCYVPYAKGVYHTCKIAYDPEYACYSPGKLLFYHMLKHCHQQAECRAIDFYGEMTETTSRWKPDTYTIGQIIVAPRRFVGRAALRAYQCYRRIRGRSAQRIV
jgi:CelD/BcsL family acetyltransferase involved in cellulose biosynthesis